MKKLILAAFLASAVAAVADLALVAPPATIASATTNAIVAPAGMTGWAEIEVAAVMPTNKPAVYEVLTYEGTGTTFRAVSAYTPPLTNAAQAVSLQFPAAAVNRVIALVVAPATNTPCAAILRYTPTYPPR